MCLPNSPIIMTPKNVDSRDMVSPKYGLEYCTILYPLYNINFKYRTIALAIYNKCFASLMAVPIYEAR